MLHPYTEFEGTRLWTAVESAISDLVWDNALAETTARPHIVGYLCKAIMNERQTVAEEFTARSETITSDNLAEIEWENGYFKFCNFEGFSIEGGLVSSDFHGCSFKNVDWYCGLFSQCNFIECNFIDSTFAGTNFPNSRFIDCKLTNCKFKQSNLGRECGFPRTIAYGCTVENSPGFRPDNGADIPMA